MQDLEHRWIDRRSNAAYHPDDYEGVENALLRQVLSNRDISPEGAGGFLNPSLGQLGDPDRFIDMEVAVELLIDALKRERTIGIFGDYDVDGVTSTTLLSDMLHMLGSRVVYTIPDRLREGYGLSHAGVDRLAEQGAKLLVTVDCGITDDESIAYAKSKGLKVVVIDHHQVPAKLPRADAVVNPHRPDCPSGAHHLCAVGLTFYLCASLRRAMRVQGAFSTHSNPEPDLRAMLDVVALGTVADVMPLTHDNRVFVARGLDAIRAGGRLGLNALLDVAKVEQSRLRSGHLGFQLGPRINAAGRLGLADDAVALLKTPHRKTAMQMAMRLDKMNNSRREIEHATVLEACEMIDADLDAASRACHVLYSPDWHPGVVGIVASRLAERYALPVLVIGAGGRGSGRSVPGVDLYQAIRASSEHLLGFGGHAHAAGIQIEVGKLNAFRESMHHEVLKLRKIEPRKDYYFDGELKLASLKSDLVSVLNQAAPYGRGNPEPTWVIRGAETRSVKLLRGGHLKASLMGSQNFEVIMFGAEEREREFSGTIDMLGTLGLNRWQGRETPQLVVKDFRRSQ